LLHVAVRDSASWNLSFPITSSSVPKYQVWWARLRRRLAELRAPARWVIRIRILVLPGWRSQSKRCFDCGLPNEEVSAACSALHAYNISQQNLKVSGWDELHHELEGQQIYDFGASYWIINLPWINGALIWHHEGGHIFDTVLQLSILFISRGKMLR